ncbi:unnamed protein product [Camellia sinensis]
MRHRLGNLRIDCRCSSRNSVPIAITSALVAIALLGTVIGQLIFGYLDLPCDEDGICMICKKKSAEDETITCKVVSMVVL